LPDNLQSILTTKLVAIRTLHLLPKEKGIVTSPAESRHSHACHPVWGWLWQTGTSVGDQGIHCN
jgi:hypothetical protein